MAQGTRAAKGAKAAVLQLKLHGAASAQSERLGSAATDALLREYASIDKGFGKGLVLAGRFRRDWYGFIEIDRLTDNVAALVETALKR